MTVRPPDKKQILVMLRHSPYGSSLARSSIDVALAAAAFDQAVDLLFVGEGVLQLFPGQDGKELGTKSIGRLISSLPLYDVERVYVDGDAVARFNLDITKSPVPSHVLTAFQMQQLMQQYDLLLGF